MFKIQRTLFTIVLTSLLLLAGCSDSHTPETTSDAAPKEKAPLVTAQKTGNTDTTAKDLFNHIPANSSYLLAMLEPLPKELLEAYFKLSRSTLGNFIRIAEKEQGADEKNRKTLDFLNHLHSNLSYDKLGETGFSPEALWGLYSKSGYPVIRGSISDNNKLKTLIELAAAIDNHELEWKHLDNYDYLLVAPEPSSTTETGNVHLLLAISKEWLVLSLLPKDVSDETIAETLGVEKSANRFEITTLKTLNHQYNYLPHGSGYLNLQAITKELYATLPTGEREAIPSACLDVLDNLTSHAPRIVAGYSRLDVQQMVMEATLELSDDVINAIKPIQQPLAGYDETQRPLYALGISADLPALREALSALLETIGQASEKCSLIDQQQIAEAQLKLSLAMNPMFSGYKSLLVALNDIELDFAKDIERPQLKHMEGVAIASMNDPRSTLALLSLFMPQLSTLKLPDDGTPVTLPISKQQLQLDATVKAALNKDRLGVTVGAPDEQLKSWLASSPADDSPFLWIAYDYSRFMSLLDTALVADVKSDTDAEMVELIKELYGFFGYASQTLSLSERGLHLTNKMDMQIK